MRPLTVVNDPAAWKASDWAGRQHEAVVELDADDVAQLKQAVAAFMASGRPLSALKRPTDFPLDGGLADKLAGARRDLLRGRGFALLRGLPVREWSEAESVAAYMGLGVHVGRPQPQSKDGKLVNHVKMHYTPANAPTGTLPQREHAHNLEFGVHTDAQADVLALLCINQAKEGGVSSFSSTLAVHNELLRRGRKDIVRCLASGGWYRDRSRYQDVAPGDSPVWEMPVFSYHKGYLTTHYNSSHYKLCAQRYPERAALSELQLEALRLFEEIGSHPDFAITYLLQPGDIIMLHNSSTLHARSAFKDGAEPHERRHLVRLWLGCSDDRPQPTHLNFPRTYTEGYDRTTFQGLLKPAPSKFHVPLSAEADDL